MGGGGVGMGDSIQAGALSVGSSVAGYRLRQDIRRRNFSIFYLARSPEEQDVIVQELFPALSVMRSGDEVRLLDADDRPPFRWWVRSFVDKGLALRAIRHPNVARVLDAFEANGTGYLVTQVVAGETLAERIARKAKLERTQVDRLLEGALRGLHALHAAGISHRAIQPASLVMQADGRCVLVDPGEIRAPIRLGRGTLTYTNDPAFVAAEEAEGREPASWFDLHALAATVVAALGIDRSAADLANRLRNACPTPVADSLTRMLSPDPAQRFDSAQAWMSAIGLTPDTTETVDDVPATGPRRTPIAAIAGAAVALAAVAVVVTTQFKSTPSDTGPASAGIESSPLDLATSGDNAPDRAARKPTPASASPDATLEMARRIAHAQAEREAAERAEADRLEAERLEAQRQADAQLHSAEPAAVQSIAAAIPERNGPQPLANAETSGEGSRSAGKVPGANPTTSAKAESAAPSAQPTKTEVAPRAPLATASEVASTPASTASLSAGTQPSVQPPGGGPPAANGATDSAAAEAAAAARRAELIAQVLGKATPNLRYPPKMIARVQVATTTIAVQVLPSGAIDDVRLYKSSRVEVLDRAALEAVRTVTRIAAPNEALEAAGSVTLHVPVEFRYD